MFGVRSTVEQYNEAERIAVLGGADVSPQDAFQQHAPSMADAMQRTELADQLRAGVARLQAMDGNMFAADDLAAVVGNAAVGARFRDRHVGAEQDDEQRLFMPPEDVDLASSMGAGPQRHGQQEVGAAFAIEAFGGGRQTDQVWQQRNAMLGDDQRAVLGVVQEHISQNQRATSTCTPLRLFITGGAGTGKSFLIAQLSCTAHRAVHAQLTELYMRTHPSVSKPVVLLAPTGVAAFNIGGTTIHNLLRLPVEHGRERAGSRARVQYKKLPQDKLLELAAHLYGVKCIIIDEISMVSYQTLDHAHNRLCEVFKMAPGASAVCPPFGGYSIITVGDFYQLPPVRAPYVFERILGAAAPIHHLWRGSPGAPGFVGFNLLQNQRQRGDTSWATALNALRDGRDSAAVESAAQLVKTRAFRPLGRAEPAQF